MPTKFHVIWSIGYWNIAILVKAKKTTLPSRKRQGAVYFVIIIEINNSCFVCNVLWCANYTNERTYYFHESKLRKQHLISFVLNLVWLWKEPFWHQSWCSKKPSSAFTHCFRRRRHFLTAWSTILWSNCYHSSMRRSFRCRKSRIKCVLGSCCVHADKHADFAAWKRCFFGLY